MILSGKVKLESNTKRASILIRANAKGDELVGYAATIDVENRELFLSRHRDGKIERLAKQTIDPSGGFVGFEASVVGDQISFMLGDTKVVARDPSPISGEGQCGVTSWGGSVVIAELNLNGARICRPKPDEAERRALGEFVSLLFNLNEFIYVD